MLAASLFLVVASFPTGCANITPGENSATSGWKIKFEGSGSSPAIADGVLYVGSADGALYALDARTGETRWRFQTGESLSPATSAPQIITVSPGTSVSEQMAAGMRDAQSRRETGIRRVDMTPTVESGMVFVGAGDHSFYAIDAATGKREWAYEAGPGMASMNNTSYPVPAPLVDSGTVYCVTNDGVHALDMKTGTKKWLYLGRGTSGRPAVGLVNGERLVFVAARGFLNAVSAGSGTKKWTAILDGSSVTEPVPAGELLFVATHRGVGSGSDLEETLYGIDAADGQIRWKLAAERRFGQSRLLSTGHTIYFATDMALSAVEARTGRLLWSFRGDEIQGGPAADDRHLYVSTYKRSILGASTTLHALSLRAGEKEWSRGLSGPEDIREVRQGVVYTSRSAIDASTGKTLWSFSGTGRESTRLISGDQVFLISSTVTYFGTNRVDQGYLYAIDAKTGKP